MITFFVLRTNTEMSDVEMNSSAEESDFEEINETKEIKEKRKNDPLYKNPTRDELTELNETSNMHKSNLFKLQLQELVNEVTVSDKNRNKFETALHSIKSILDNMTAMPDIQVLLLQINIIHSIGNYIKLK